MGGTVCKQRRDDPEDPLACKIDLDSRETGFHHQNGIQCRNKQMQKIIEAYVDKLRVQGTLYKDPSMPSEPILLRSKTTQIKCTYERPYKFLEDAQRNEPYKLIDFHDAHPDRIEVKDEVMQYFGVFLCFLSDKPNLIQKIITTDENSYGLHSIEAYREGKLINFLIDDCILCKDGKPIFSQPCKMRYMWPCLIEKAWFKIRGNSAKRVEQTSPEQVFETFFPLPIEKINFEEGPNYAGKRQLLSIFQNFQLSKNRGYIFTSKRNPRHDIGLSGLRYFYLLDTFMFEGRRLFYLRNPCRDMTFRGRYMQVPAAVNDIIFGHNFMKIGPGNFIIDEDELMQQMSEIMSINYVPGHKITCCGFKSGNAEELFIGFNLKYKANLSLRITQYLQNNYKNPYYFPLIYHVVRLADQKLLGGFDNRQGCFGVKHTYVLDSFFPELTPGKYIVRIKKKQYEKVLPEVQTVLTTYFLDTLSFQITTQEEMNEKWHNFLVAEAKKKLQESEDKGKSVDIGHTILWLGDLVVVYAEKMGANRKKQISVSVNFPDLKNLECISHPQIRRPDSWNTYTFSEHIVFIFEKVELAGETHIRNYHLQSF